MITTTLRRTCVNLLKSRTQTVVQRRSSQVQSFNFVEIRPKKLERGARVTWDIEAVESPPQTRSREQSATAKEDTPGRLVTLYV